MIITKNLKIKKMFSYILVPLKLSCYFCSIDLKRQSEHSGLRPDTSSLVVPILDTKVTKYLARVGFFL